MLTAKYLGVEISNEMKWNTHINNTVNKGNRTLDFLKRNIRPYSQDLKSKAYKVIIRPTLEYARAISVPYTKKHINAIEMIQRRAARYVTNRYERYASVTEMLREIQWDSLEEKRKRQQLVTCYKIHHNQVEVMKDAYIKQTSNLRPSRCFNSQVYELLGTGPQYYNFSFFHKQLENGIGSHWKQ